MAKVRMKRIEIISLLTDGKSIIERLQRRGVVDLLQSEIPEDQSGIERIDTSHSIQLFERSSATVQQALAVLDEYAPQKQSMLASFEPRTAITTAEFSEMAEKTESSIRTANELIKLSQRIAESKANRKARAQYAESLESWRSLAVSTRFSGTFLTAAFIGTLPGLWDRERLLESLKPQPDTDIPVEVQIVFSYREQSGIFVLCHKELEQECTQTLRSLGFAQPPILTDQPPAEVIEAYRQTVSELDREIENLTADIVRRSDVREQLLFTLDYLSMRADKYSALQEIAVTRQAIIIEGYIPEENAESLKAELENKYTLCVTIREPEENEEPPVAFKNALPAAALEDITASYSMPSKSDVDPNGVMSLFYYLFFGLMLSDAGYGILMVLACGLILKLKRPEGNMKRNMQKFLLCGLSTIFWGAMFNSWFGDIVSVVAKNFFGKEVKLWSLMNPVEEPMDLLLLSLVLGFIHVMAGLILKFYILWRSGQKLDALFDVGLWWVVFAGIITMLVPMMTATDLPFQSIGIGIASSGAVGLILTQGRSSPGVFGKIIGGVGSLYGITGYFSDILSYCRLMALGLVTGIIASVVNSIGSMLGGGIGGAILLIVVFLFGHAINFGINVLGAYVHCNRLQYVEFFSKFYEGGGRIFNPLQVNTRHFKFKDEN